MDRSIRSGTINSLQENKGAMDKIKDYYKCKNKLYSHWKSQTIYISG